MTTPRRVTTGESLVIAVLTVVLALPLLALVWSSSLWWLFAVVTIASLIATAAVRLARRWF